MQRQTSSCLQTPGQESPGLQSVSVGQDTPGGSDPGTVLTDSLCSLSVVSAQVFYCLVLL